MSAKVLMLAAKDRVKDIFGFADDSNVGTSYDGQPPADCGEEYFMIHLAAWRTKNETESLVEEFDLDVTLTRKTGYASQDRIGSDTILDLTIGLLERARALAIGFNMDYAMLAFCGGTRSDPSTIWASTKAYKLPDTQMGFRMPLVFSGASKIEPKGPDWFWAAPDERSADPPTGIAMTLHFVNARRTQNLTGAT